MLKARAFSSTRTTGRVPCAGARQATTWPPSRARARFQTSTTPQSSATFGLGFRNVASSKVKIIGNPVTRRTLVSYICRPRSGILVRSRTLDVDLGEAGVRRQGLRRPFDLCLVKVTRLRFLHDLSKNSDSVLELFASGIAACKMFLPLQNWRPGGQKPLVLCSGTPSRGASFLQPGRGSDPPQGHRTAATASHPAEQCCGEGFGSSPKSARHIW